MLNACRQQKVTIDLQDGGIGVTEIRKLVMPEVLRPDRSINNTDLGNGYYEPMSWASLPHIWGKAYMLGSVIAFVLQMSLMVSGAVLIVKRLGRIGIPCFVAAPVVQLSWGLLALRFGFPIWPRGWPLLVSGFLCLVIVLPITISVGKRNTKDSSKVPMKVVLGTTSQKGVWPPSPTDQD